jgi:hypothetical protein
MRYSLSHKPTVLAIYLVALFSIASVLAVTATGFLAGPGKYCGVVVFDRWGNCFLLEGRSIVYVAEKVKKDLLPYKDQAVQVDALEISQTGMHAEHLSILKYNIAGPAPDSHRWFAVDGLRLTAVDDFGSTGKPRFTIEIRNVGQNSINVDRSQLGVVVLESIRPDPSSLDPVPAALISGWGIDSPFAMAYEKMGSKKTSWGYTVDLKTRPPARFVLAPGQLLRTRLTFKLYSGQYQLMLGYGGGGQMDEKSVASNAISFDMSSTGRATLVK